MNLQQARNILRRTEPTVAVRRLLLDLPTLTESEILDRMVELGLVTDTGIVA